MEVGKVIKRGEENQENDFAPSEKYACYPPEWQRNAKHVRNHLVTARVFQVRCAMYKVVMVKHPLILMIFLYILIAFISVCTYEPK